MVDVDLMRPVARALEGIIVVDDCAPDGKYEGAYAAYTEFVRRWGLPVDIRHDKLGVIQIPT